MAASKILIVEDETPIREMIAFHLSRAGYETVEAEDCRQAREVLADERPDLALIDGMLPDMSGLELTRTLKRDGEHEDLAIIMLTARADEHDKVSGLEGGADDYVTKPFSPKELIARIQAVLRRSNSTAGELIKAGIIELDPAGHRVYSRTQLLDRVWGANVYVEERTVDVHVRRLRKALSPSGADDYIQTVRGAGYRFSIKGD